jgi:hypothetical protein
MKKKKEKERKAKFLFFIYLKKKRSSKRKKERKTLIRVKKKEDFGHSESKRGKIQLHCKKSEIKRALFSHQPLIVLMYKEALLYTNDLSGALPSDIVSLLQKFEDVFPEEVPCGLPPIQGIIKLISYLVHQFQTDLLIGAILRRPRNFKGK